ncbi:MAG: tRNA (N(6)-L-threonylcarbamoyladenosine(37)-C(2))-methylthiotransferase MtaB [Lachnospiraceae bacterium]|nr:tRNA (N(6)-L-threonylcarbamoyladenosine(37)-C(2))-methylthiotransferase MtaB [Lachnospiraceae bacterium]
METVALHNLGCKVNTYETEKMAALLQNAGYRIVPFTEKADIYVVNTCSVTQMADKKSRQMLHRARRLNPDAVVIAAGCFVQAGGITPEEIGADILLGNDKKGELISVLSAYRSDKKAKTAVIDINDPDECYEELYREASKEVTGVPGKAPAGGEPVEATAVNLTESPTKIPIEGPAENRPVDETAGRHIEASAGNLSHPHTRAFVKIQDGCNQFCSYCRIPFVRGRTRSRTAASVLDEIAQMLRHGYKEIVLTGIHVSSYRDGETDLIGLIEKIDALPGMRRLRLSSMEPRLITEEAARRLSKCASLCPHFHLSLQSGCDATIKRMNRHYTTAQFEEGVTYLRKYFTDPAITTDVIAGFPGETKEEFAATKEFVQKIGFADMHVFKYSPREGTRAFAFDGQVSEETKNLRSDELLLLAEKMNKVFCKTWEGRMAEVLFEECVAKDGKEYWTGFTREYLRVYAESGEDLKNRIRPMEFHLRPFAK